VVKPATIYIRSPKENQPNDMQKDLNHLSHKVQVNLLGEAIFRQID
jgi:hypothetical protein